jgi:hypothetical protein
MAEKPATDPLDLLQISRDLLATPQRFLPSTHIYTRIAEIMRDVAQAHATYVQELMRANAALLAAFMERPGAAENEGPAAAVRRPDRNAS